MRQGWAWAVAGAAVGLLGGCSQEALPATTPANVLVLEVGGEQPSLRAALTALGRDVGPMHQLVPAAADAGYDGVGDRHSGDLAPYPFEGGTGGGGEGPGPDRDGPQPYPVDPEPQPTPQPAPSEWVTVPLPEGETLIHVARRHLGDGRRFHELMKWNGWTDDDARRLKSNQPVKIKRSEMRSSGG